MLRALTTRKRGRPPSSGTMLRSAQLILGQAGSGKTRMVAKKVISLAQKEQGVLVITGSEDGRQKILDAAYDGLSLGRGLGVLEVHTLGSLSKRVVSEFGGEHHGLYLDHGGGVGDRMLQGRAGVAVFLQQHLQELPLQRLKPRHNVRQALLSLSSFFLRLQGVGIEAKDYVKATHDDDQPFRMLWSDEAWALEQEKAQAYLAYQDLKAKTQCFDGLDLVLHARSILAGVGEAGRVLGQRHPHVLVDDLHLLPSPLLLPMLQSIVAPPDPSATSATKTTLLATADPDPTQWVLGLYGTSELPPPSLLEQHQSPVPSPIDAFTTAFPTTTTLSPPPYKPRGKKRQRGWEAVASQSIGVEAEGKGSVEGRGVVQWVFREQSSEMAALAHNVHQAAITQGHRVLVVVPKWRHVAALLGPLQAMGLQPHCPAGGDAPLLLDETTLVRPLLSLLQCLSSWSVVEEGPSGLGEGPSDNLALHHVLTLHFQRQPHTLAHIHRLLERCRTRHESLWHTLNQKCGSGELPVEVGPLLSTLRTLASAQHHLPTSKLLLQYLQDTGLLSSLESPSTAHEEAQARALSELLTFITTHLETRHHHDHRLCGVLPGLLLYRDYPNTSATLSSTQDNTTSPLQHQQHHNTNGKKTGSLPLPPVTVLPWSSCWSHEGGPYDVIFLPYAHHDALPPRLPPQHLPLPPFLLLPHLPPHSPLLSPSTLRALTPHLQQAGAHRTFFRLVSRLRPCPSSLLLLSYSRQLPGRKREARPSSLSLNLGLPMHHLPLAPPSPAPPSPSPAPLLPLPPSPLEPFEQLVSPPAPVRLSYSSVCTYRRCPLAYYYSHVLHLSPPPTPLMLYGRALHAAVARALQPLTLDPATQIQHARHAFTQVAWSHAELVAVCLVQEWEGEGGGSPVSFVSSEEKQQLEAQAHEAITHFIHRYSYPSPPDKNSPVFLYPWQHQQEQPQLDTDTPGAESSSVVCHRSPVLLEHRFELPLSLPSPLGPPLQLTLSGVLDRVDLLTHPSDSSAPPAVWLVEYKSCVGPSRSMASLANGPYAALQLRLYALALSHMLQQDDTPAWLPPSLPRPVCVSTLVLESIEDGRTAIQAIDSTDTFEDVLSVLLEVGSGVQRRDFSPSPSPHNCAMCPHQHTCPASATHTHTHTTTPLPPQPAKDTKSVASIDQSPRLETLTHEHETEGHTKHQSAAN